MAKQRSPNYPSVGLDEAVLLVKLIYEKEKKTQVSGDVVATAMGYKGLSGPVRAKMAALKKYGLLDGDERKGLKVSDLSIRILYPSDASDALDAKRKAALTPELFRSLYDEMREGSDAAFLSFLVNKREFSPVGARQAIAAYRDTLTFAELPESGYNASETPDKGGAENMNRQEQVASGDLLAASEAFKNLGKQNGPPTLNVWTWTLSVPREVKAQLHVAGAVTKADIGRLRKQIEFLEDSFDEAAN